MSEPRHPSADTVRRQAAAALSAAGIDSAAAEAAELVVHELGVEPGRLLLIDEVTDAQRRRIEHAVALRAERIPLQHITARAHFAGLELIVGPGVFVPRPETELLVEWALARIAAPGSPRPVHVVDLCSGSGALALAIAAAAPTATVTAVERSTVAADYLRRNVEAQHLTGRVRIALADATDGAAMAPLLQTASIVVSNPPYVPAASPVSPEVAHDPPEAVFSGASGMDVIAAMAPILAAATPPGCAVAIEHDDTTSDQVVDALRRTGGLEQVQAHRDLAGRPRFVSAVRSGGRGDERRAPEPDDGVEGWTA